MRQWEAPSDQKKGKYHNQFQEQGGGSRQPQISLLEGIPLLKKHRKMTGNGFTKDNWCLKNTKSLLQGDDWLSRWWKSTEHRRPLTRVPHSIPTAKLVRQAWGKWAMRCLDICLDCWAERTATISTKFHPSSCSDIPWGSPGWNRQ